MIRGRPEMKDIDNVDKSLTYNYIRTFQLANTTDYPYFCAMKKYPEHLLILGLALLIYFTSSSAPADESQAAIVTDSVSRLWTLDQSKLIGDTTIEVDLDPFFKSPKRYRAFPLKDNLEAVVEGIEDISNFRVIFECTDGYRPQMPLELVLSSNGFLAFHDLSQPTDKMWADSLTNKLAPFYLVWPEISPDNKTYTTPYGLYQIQVVPADEILIASRPKNDSHLEGYELFSKTCMRCHSINKVGGAMAPELNYPKNITEYWAKEDIWQFIQSPQSYRYNAKMPPLKDLKRENFEKVYAYLQGMKGQKLEQ